jgi:hypothetical protein
MGEMRNAYKILVGKPAGKIELKMKATQTSETLVSNHHSTQHNNAENHKFYLPRHENLKSRT